MAIQIAVSQEIEHLTQHLNPLLPWTVISCDLNTKSFKSTIRRNNSSSFIQIKEIDESILAKALHGEVIWIIESCPLEHKEMVLALINDKQIQNLWIVGHKTEETLFPNKIHQNIVHYIESENLFKEWKYLEGAFSTKEVVGDKEMGIIKRLEYDDFNGKTIRAIVELSPWISFNNYTEILTRKPNVTDSGQELRQLSWEDDISGPIPRLLDMLGERYNFTTDFYYQQGYGLKNETTQKWSGMVGTLVAGEADIAAAGVGFAKDRFEVISYLPPMGSFSDFILIKGNNSIEFSWKVFLKPFVQELWVFILSYCVVVSIFFTFYFDGMNSRFSSFKQSSVYCVSKVWDIFETSFLVLGSVFGNDPFPEKKIKGWAYFVTFMVSFSGMVAFIAYQGSLTSELAVKKIKLPFSTFQELMDSDYR